MENYVNQVRAWLGTGSINIFGMPYAGKDTQGQALADLLEGEVLGGGEILRNSVIPDHVREIQDKGGLIPSDEYQKIVLPYLSHEKFAGKPLILSAVGRRQGEEIGVLQATESAGHPIRAVILLTVSEDVARERHRTLGSQDRGDRADDSEEIFNHRLQVYKDETLPVIAYYRDHGQVVEIDGSLKPIAVTGQIIEQLAALANATVSAPQAHA